MAYRADRQNRHPKDRNHSMKSPKHSAGEPDPEKRRGDSIWRYLFGPRHFRDSMALAKQPSLRNSMLAGLQAAIVVAIALPLIHISPWSHQIGFAALGALVALFGRFAPPGRRNRIVLLCAIWQSLAVLGMSLASWLSVPVELQLVGLALSCGAFFYISVTGQFGAP